MIKANISLRDRIQFNDFKWQSSCFKNLRDTVICRSLCDKLCIRGITELLRMREAKWLIPSTHPWQKRVQSSSVRQPPTRSPVEQPYRCTPLSIHTLLAPSSLCWHLPFPFEKAAWLLFLFLKICSCYHGSWFSSPLWSPFSLEALPASASPRPPDWG